MPRKCCTIYDGKPCRANYKETKTHKSENEIVFGFPQDLQEQQQWKNSLPNVLTCEISKTIGICAKHWPPDCPKRPARGGCLVPTVPPSLFGETKNPLSDNHWIFQGTQISEMSHQVQEN